MPETTDRRLVETILAEGGTAKRVLNLPSGHGELTERLAKLGVPITAADLCPEISRWKPDEVVKADMNEPLPFEDDAFDIIVCQEGIEHLEDVPCFLRECRRILVDGGLLLLTLPNFMDLSSRLSFLLTGMKSFHGELPNEEGTLWGSRGDIYYHGHAFTLTFFQIRYLLRLNHFAEIEIWNLKDSNTSRLLWWFLRPFMGVMLRRSMLRRARDKRSEDMPAPSPQLIDELTRLAVSRELLVAKRIGIRCTLREGSFRPVKASGAAWEAAEAKSAVAVPDLPGSR